MPAERSLYLFPTIHTEYSIYVLDAQSKTIELATKSLLVNWQQIGQILSLNMFLFFGYMPDSSIERLHVFFEGAVPGSENKFLQETKDSPEEKINQSKNIRKLVERGARITGIDDPVARQRLETTYVEYYKAGMRKDAVATKRLGEKLTRERDSLRERRDFFAARKIDNSLTADEQGVLIMGVKHNIPLYLPADFKVTTPKQAFAGLTQDLLERYSLWQYFEPHFAQLS